MNSSIPTIDSAAAAIHEDRLSDVLTHVHREGFGHNAQVIRPERGRTLERLRHAGLDLASIDRLAAHGQPIVLIFAPARVDAAEIILRRGGANLVERFVQSSGTQSALIGFDPAVLHLRRSGRRSRHVPGI